MRNFLAMILMSVLSLAGCAAASDEGAQGTPEPAVQQQPAPAVQSASKADAKSDKKKGKEKKSDKARVENRKSPTTEAEIRADLDVVGRALVSKASRTITPSKANRSVHQSGKEFVSRYIEINPNQVSTDMRPGNKAGTYIGFVRYSEQVFECKGKTKQQAMSSTACNQTATRGMNEMIMFDGKAWRF